MKHGMISQLRWTKPGSDPLRPGEPFARPPVPQPGTSTGRCLERYGIPEVPIEKPTPAETALFLLKAAAEIEHGLLVQYLYAKYSLNSPPAPLGWSNLIRAIALQEMDHLATVQNMLLSLKINNFEPYFDRANFPIPKDHEAFYPYAFRLEPFTGDSLSKYVSVESPLPESINDSALRTELETVIRRAEAVTGMKTFGHVGNLYAYLYWLFLPNDNYAGPWPSFPADWFHRHRPDYHVAATDFVDDVARLAQLQIYFREVEANDGNAANYPHNDTSGTHRWVFAVKTADDALRAIAQIAIQGEGTEMATDSHFLEFLGVYRQLAVLTPPGGGSVHRMVPTDPHLRPDPDVAGGLIVNTVTRLWAELCNTRYLMLLEELPLTMTIDRLDSSGTANPDRATLIGVVITEMRSAIPYLSTKLTTLPLDTDPTRFAGPPFELPLEALPAGPAGRWKELVRLIDVTNGLLSQLPL